VNNLPKVALDRAAAGIEPAISNGKSNAITTTPPSHALYLFEMHFRCSSDLMRFSLFLSLSLWSDVTESASFLVNLFSLTLF